MAQRRLWMTEMKMGRKLRGLHDERGQMVVISAFVIVALLAFLGMVIDVGFLYAEHRQAQNAADQAAKAAAYEISYGGSTAAAVQAALGNAHDNGYNNDGVNNTVTVNIPPLSGSYAGNADYVEVIVTEQPTTFFIHVVLGDSGGVAARGVAGLTATSGGVYALFANNGACGGQSGLEVSGSTNVFNGAVHSNSEVKVNGSDNIFNGLVTHTCSLDVGGQNNTFSPPPSSAVSQPLPVNYSYGDFPCMMTFTQPTDLNSVPEAWVDSDSNSGQLLPGVYCSTKKLSLSGSDVTGSVTLVSQDEVNVSGSNFNLTPFWNDVLLFSDDSFPKGIDISGSGGNWEGIVLAPNGLAKIAGSSNFAYSGAVIADVVQISGSNTSLTAIDYGQGGPATVALVE